MGERYSQRARRSNGHVTLGRWRGFDRCRIMSTRRFQLVPSRDMNAEELAREREAIVAQHGGWSAQNLHIGAGVYTIGPNHVHAAERRMARVVRIVADVAGVPLDELRILDLGAYECGFSIELAEHGAQVTAVEVREQHAVKGEFVRRARGLDTLTIRQGDIRELGSLVEGEFDVVLCLGLIYHLDARDAVAMLNEIARRTTRFAIIEGQISLTRATEVEVDGANYSGLLYREDERDPGSGVKMSQAFWFTRPSLIRAISNAGFSTVAEVHLPVVAEVLPFEDHVTMLAFKGDAVPLRAIPAGADAALAAYPEDWERLAHPVQGLRYRVRERWARMRGGGMHSIFPSGPPER